MVTTTSALEHFEMAIFAHNTEKMFISILEKRLGSEGFEEMTSAKLPVLALFQCCRSNVAASGDIHIPLILIQTIGFGSV